MPSGFVDILKVKFRKCPHNRDRRLLAGKCINNRMGGRSRKRVELIVYCFRKRHLWGSKLHADYFITLQLVKADYVFPDIYMNWCTPP